MIEPFTKKEKKLQIPNCIIASAQVNKDEQNGGRPFDLRNF